MNSASTKKSTMQSVPRKVLYHSWKRLQTVDDVAAIPVIVASDKLTPDDMSKQLNSKWNEYPHHVREQDIITLTRSNDPIENVKLSSVNERTATCRITFTMGDALYQTQLQTSVLLEIAQSVGIEKGGIISAPLVWVNLRRRPHMKLMRVGSDAYFKHKSRDDKVTREIIPKRGLEPGCLYESLNGMQAIFVAHIHTIDFWSFRGGESAERVLRWNMWRHAMLWYGTWRSETIGSKYHWDVVQGFIDGPDLPHFEVRRSHAYRVDLGKVVDVDFGSVRDTIVQQMIKNLTSDGLRIYGLRDSGKFLTMVPTTEEPTIGPQAKELIKTHNAIIIGPGTPIEELPELQAHENKYVREEAERYYKWITQGGK